MANYNIALHANILTLIFNGSPFLRGLGGSKRPNLSVSRYTYTTSQKLCNTLVDRVAFFWEIGMRGGDGGDVNYTRLLK
jgi:hypothetical protein